MADKALLGQLSLPLFLPAELSISEEAGDPVFSMEAEENVGTSDSEDEDESGEEEEEEGLRYPQLELLKPPWG